MSDMKRRNHLPDDAKSSVIDTSVAQQKTKKNRGQYHLHAFFDDSWLHDSSLQALLHADQSDPSVDVLDSRKKLSGVINDQHNMIHDLTKSIVVCVKIRARLLKEAHTILEPQNAQLQQFKDELLEATETQEKLGHNVPATMDMLTYIESTHMRLNNINYQTSSLRDYSLHCSNKQLLSRSTSSR
jgi:hypothetical protein